MRRRSLAVGYGADPEGFLPPVAQVPVDEPGEPHARRTKTFATSIELTAAEFELPGVFMHADDTIPEPQAVPRRVLQKTRGEILSIHAARQGGGLRRQFAQVADEAGDELINFMDVVDIDFGEAWDSYVSDDLVGRMLESVAFRLTILFLIVLNSILIGMQTDRGMEKRFSSTLSAVDMAFLIVFVVEILLKWYHGFMEFWKSGWNVFDFLIVSASLLGPSLSFLASGRVLRILKVVRAFRSLRSISALQGLQVIVQTILQSLPDMLNILLLLLIMGFIFAVVGVTLFGEDVSHHFGSLDSALFTLFIVVTQDGWVQIFQEMEDRGLYAQAAVYFVCFITVGAFILANVFVGVVVTNLQVAYNEMKRHRKAGRRKLVQVNDFVAGKTPMIPLVKTNTIDQQVYKHQKPLEIPDISQIPPSVLENYFLVVSAIEDNIAEYAQIKDRIYNTINIVRDINAMHLIDSDEDPAFDDATPDGSVVSGSTAPRSHAPRQYPRTRRPAPLPRIGEDINSSGHDSPHGAPGLSGGDDPDHDDEDDAARGDVLSMQIMRHRRKSQNTLRKRIVHARHDPGL